MFKGLEAEEIIVEDERSIGEQCGDAGGQPALGGFALAIPFAPLLGNLGAASGRILLGLDRQGQEQENAVVALGVGRGRSQVRP